MGPMEMERGDLEEAWGNPMHLVSVVDKGNCGSRLRKLKDGECY